MAPTSSRSAATSCWAGPQAGCILGQSRPRATTPTPSDRTGGSGRQAPGGRAGSRSWRFTPPAGMTSSPSHGCSREPADRGARESARPSAGARRRPRRRPRREDAVRRGRGLHARNRRTLVGRASSMPSIPARSHRGSAPARRRSSAASSGTRALFDARTVTDDEVAGSRSRDPVRAGGRRSGRRARPVSGTELRVCATAGHVDHGKSSLDRPPHGHRPRSLGGGEAPGPHDRPRIRVDDAPVRQRDRVRGRPRPRTLHPQHAGGGRPGAPGAVRGRRRRGLEAASPRSTSRSSTSSASPAA